MDDQGLDHIRILDLDVSVYVAKINTDIENVRNQFMKFIGGQFQKIKNYQNLNLFFD